MMRRTSGAILCWLFLGCGSTTTAGDPATPEPTTAATRTEQAEDGTPTQRSAPDASSEPADPQPRWVPMIVTVQAVGGLSQQQAMSAAAEQLPALGRGCHAEVDTRTEIELGLTIQKTGKVEAAEIVGEVPAREQPAAQCTARQAERWSFPAERPANVLLRVAWVERSEAQAQEQLRNAIAEQGKAAAQQCHQHLDASSGEERIWARLMLRANGKVMQAQIATKNRPLARCLEQAMSRWSFPAGADRRVVAVPLVLKPK